MVPPSSEPRLDDAIEKLKNMIHNDGQSSSKRGIVGSEGNLLKPGMFSKNPRLSRSSFRGERKESLRVDRQRHNSWHNLVELDGRGRYPGERRPRSSDDYGAGDEGEEKLAKFVNKQESYIQQLENENQYFRQQVVAVLRLVKAGGDEELRGLREENERLRNGVPPESTRHLIDGLRHDVEMLNGALAQARQDNQVLDRKEAEAVDQVRRSVEVAEQMRLERSEMEYEIGQLKLQIDRLQMRVHSLVEEQADMVEKERVQIEKHFHNQVHNMREELERQAADLGKAGAEIEQRKGTEQDLLRQLGEKDRSLENVRNEHDKQIANFRAENFDLLKLRQKLEIDASGLKLELDNCKQIHSADNKRLEEEIRGLKSRLSSTQDSLGGCRQECLNLAEVKASLEREVNHLRVRGPLPAGVATGAPLPLCDEFPTRDTDTRAEEGLRTNMYALAQKQNSIILELKGQCSVATDKIESLVKQFTREKEQYEYSLAVLAKQTSDGSERCPNCNSGLLPSAGGQQASSKVYETLCQKLEELQNERLEKLQVIRDLKQENFKLQHINSPAKTSKAITIVKSSRPLMR